MTGHRSSGSAGDVYDEICSPQLAAARPRVSVACTTFNHEPFLRQCIESVLAQTTEFPYEMVIGEDGSSDGTRAICLEYQRRFPDRIRLLLMRRNIRSLPNWILTGRSCRGEYVAWVEGDDFWTQPDKLRRQVAFLDASPECAMCFHPAVHVDGEGRPLGIVSPVPGRRALYTVEDLLRYCNFIPTASVVYRRGLFGDYPDWFHDLPFGDWPLHVLNALHGQIGFLDDAMCAYRVHAGGLHSSLARLVYLEKRLRVYRVFRRVLPPGYRDSIAAGMAAQNYNLVRSCAAENRRVAGLRHCLAGWLLYPCDKRRAAEYAGFALKLLSGRVHGWVSRRRG